MFLTGMDDTEKPLDRVKVSPVLTSSSVLLSPTNYQLACLGVLTLVVGGVHCIQFVSNVESEEGRGPFLGPSRTDDVYYWRLCHRTL